MDEQEFDSWQGLRPFGSQDVKQFERAVALASTLWDPGISHIEHQLLAPHPEIPVGFDLADFRNLQQQLQVLLIALQRKPPAHQTGPVLSTMNPEIRAGTESFTLWEACYEIVRRAIALLEGGSNLG